MNGVLEESKFESGSKVRAAGAGACGYNAREVAKRIEKGVNHAKAVVTEKLEDGKIAAGRLLKRGRFAVEDGIEETAHSIKHHPFSSLAIAFAAGATLAFLVPRLGKK
jgi:ElaB/YqjD/DUF883 family membrane-anchored ribosome-binding protein